MKSEKLKEKAQSQKAGYRSAINVGLALPFGFLLGLMLDNVGIGLSLGLGIGGLANAIQEHRSGEEGGAMAIAIWILALAVVIGLWVWL